MTWSKKALIVPVLFSAMLAPDAAVQAQSLPQPPELKAERDLAQRLSDTGKYADAIKAADRAVLLAKRVFGTSHVETARVLKERGRVRTAAGDKSGALKDFESSLDILGSNDMAVSVLAAELHADIGASLRLQGQIDSAKNSLSDAISVARQATGADSLETSQHVLALGELMMRDNLPDKARSLFLRVAESRAEHLGSGHRETAQALKLAAEAAASANDLDLAKTEYLTILSLESEALGETHPAVGATLIGLSRLYRRTGDLLQSEATVHQALDILTSRFGHESTRLIPALDELALVLRKLGRLEEADRYASRAIEIGVRDAERKTPAQ